MSSTTGETTAGRDGTISLLSHLAVGANSLLAGVVLGGWLAFETGYWAGFKSLVEGSAAVGVPLAVGLCLLALALSLLTSLRVVGN